MSSLDPSPLRALLVLASLSATSLAQEQPEVAVNYDEAAEPIILGYWQYTRDSEINPSTDIDVLTFCGEQGELIWLQCQATANNMDPVVEIYDPSGALLSSKSCSNGCALRIETTLPLDGWYNVIVRDSGTNETGPYTLQLERMPPAHNPRPLDYNQSLRDRINRGSDVDWFVFAAEAGAFIKIPVNATFNNMDPVVDVVDPSGAIAGSGSCSNGCSFTIDINPVPVSGNYLVRVTDSGLNEGGEYEIGLNLIFGDRPAFPASAWSNLALGLAGGDFGIPVLTGLGNMEPGSSLGLQLQKALPGTGGFLLIGSTRLDQFFRGGFMVPDPHTILPIAVNADGKWSASVTWPSGVPSGQLYYCQAWIPDASAPEGYAASNAIQGITP